MTIHINRPDSLGTFAVQDSGIEENIQPMFPGFLILAERPENNHFNNILSRVNNKSGNEVVGADKNNQVPTRPFASLDDDLLDLNNNAREKISSDFAATFNAATFQTNLLATTSFEPTSDAIDFPAVTDTKESELTRQNNAPFAPLLHGVEEPLAEIVAAETKSDFAVIVPKTLGVNDGITLLKSDLPQVLTEPLRDEVVATNNSQSSIGQDLIEPEAAIQLSSLLRVAQRPDAEGIAFLTTGKGSEYEQKERVPSKQSFDVIPDSKADSIENRPTLPDISLSRVTANSKSSPLSGEAMDDEKKPDMLLSLDKSIPSVNRDNVIKMISDLSTGEPAQNTQPYDALLGNVADFFNKRLAVVDPLVGKSKTNTVAITGDLYSNQENKSALKAFQFSASGMATSLKVEGYSAKIKVYPPDLGQITAEILMNKGVAELTLRADNPQVKHFIETNLQQLRESFQNTNINLGHVSVQDNLMQDNNEFQKHYQPTPFSGLDIPLEAHKENQRVPAARPQSDSLIDTYA